MLFMASIEWVCKCIMHQSLRFLDNVEPLSLNLWRLTEVLLTHVRAAQQLHRY